MSPFPFLRTALALVLAAAAVLPAQAQAQSSAGRSIRFVVPFGPGGAGDLTARIVAQKMSESLGQPIVVDNKPGAGGVVANSAVAKAPPDGQTLLLLTNAVAVTASLFKTLPYDTMKDLAPVTTLGYFDMALVTAPDSRFKSLPELLAYARANPGRLNIGTINVGSSQNLVAQMFKSAAGIDAQVVPFNGTPAVVTALRGGSIDAAVEIVGPLIGQIRGNAVRALALMGEKRSSALPDVPTAGEAGVPRFGVSAWNGLGTTGGTPPAVVERLNKAANAALASPEVRKQLADLYVEARGSTPEQMATLLQSEIQRWSQVIEQAGIPKQ
ncbi:MULTISPECIES: tripartite tricarboxylate transporter substrate binding protein [Ramlibacter]|uniref:Tripartite tricarboxylate transporter substrate binding protein n=1 Tax=Ramlibacter pinisoli TaxID=2682844 RepID=A0A6N8IVM2_9BURK|nr:MULTISPECIES: tripartite tricarboxylate transporter substrate binding protein [Ramlibacter]MBA2961075.1 tripartite tricarboxylate transporter substrate binding protein [Ramlibacter sp. CGMCC 1.13660]MVQ31019.1 tripartite tricarboxylate transporter substrate binding protein [Ramlibacter pinisoli]